MDECCTWGIKTGGDSCGQQIQFQIYSNHLHYFIKSDQTLLLEIDYLYLKGE